MHPSDIDNEEVGEDGYTAAAKHGVLAGWARVASDDGLYFCEIASGESEWSAPEGSAPGAEYWPADKAGLPLGWTRVLDDDGTTFYRDFVNDEAQYEEPTEPAAGALEAFEGHTV